MQEKPTARKTSAGLGVLPNGDMYVKGWPSHLKILSLGDLEKQTLVEAASWCKKAGTA